MIVAHARLRCKPHTQRTIAPPAWLIRCYLRPTFAGAGAEELEHRQQWSIELFSDRSSDAESSKKRMNSVWFGSRLCGGCMIIPLGRLRLIHDSAASIHTDGALLIVK